MARQMGSIPITGTIDGLTFYLHPDDGYLARAKSSLTKEKVLKHPAFRRFKLLRRSLASILFPAADGKLSSRMNTAMLNVIYSDLVSEGGERKFDKGNPGLLKDFEFNIRHELDEVFTDRYVIARNKANDELYISIPSFTIASKIVAREYASHFKFIASRVVINFDEGSYRSVVGETIRMALGQAATENLQFILPSKPLPGSIDFVVMGIVFSGELKKIPRGGISQRKRNKLKVWRDADGVAEFTGALKVVRVVKAVESVELGAP
jgi:hypothetical protein